MCINVVYSWIKQEENVHAALLLTKNKIKIKLIQKL